MTGIILLVVLIVIAVVLVAVVGVVVVLGSAVSPPWGARTMPDAFDELPQAASVQLRVARYL